MKYQVYKYDRTTNNRNIPLGIDLPMNPSRGSNFKLNYSTIDQAKANLVNLLLTNKGERLMQPSFGCDIKKILFDPMTEDIDEDIKSVISDSIAEWLPYIYINQLQIDVNYDANKVTIGLVVSLVNNKIDTRSIQLEINIL